MRLIREKAPQSSYTSYSGAIFLVVMFGEYSSPGSGISSPFGLITPTSLWVNTTAWGVPTVMLLFVVHSKRFRRLVEGDSRKPENGTNRIPHAP